MFIANIFDRFTFIIVIYTSFTFIFHIITCEISKNIFNDLFLVFAWTFTYICAKMNVFP